MARIGIIDAELISERQSRFPNLACMKLAGYHKQQGAVVELLMTYGHIQEFDKVYISAVFTETAQRISPDVLGMPNVTFGGTGFHYAKYGDALPLPAEVEHSLPDYTLYRPWLRQQPLSRITELRYYMDASIGFLTRGCIRRCPFCVNRDATKVVPWSPLEEFLDRRRRYVVLLDDNILAYGKRCVPLINHVIDVCHGIGCRLEFKQGLDVRLMNDEYARLLARAPHAGDIVFAFDDLQDREEVEHGLRVFRHHLPTANAKAYILCGYERQDVDDIAGMFERLSILWRHRTLGYVMRHDNYNSDAEPMRSIYDQLARWCNQPAFQRSISFRQFCRKTPCSHRALRAFEAEHRDVARCYFDRVYGNWARGVRVDQLLRVRKIMSGAPCMSFSDSF